jgi:hypothetical protein
MCIQGIEDQLTIWRSLIAGRGLSAPATIYLKSQLHRLLNGSTKTLGGILPS